MNTPPENIPELERTLGTGLENPPGENAHRLMAPYPAEGTPPPRPAGAGTPAAALILLYPRADHPHVLLTVRSRSLPHHPGQVSLPGGLREEHETLEAAALREAQEETGVDPSRVRVLGCLSPLFIPPTRFTLHPFVGTSGSLPPVRGSEAEVDRVVEVPLRHLCAPTRWRRERRVLAGRDYRVPYFDVGGEKVWGATAMVLAEFLWVLGVRIRWS